MTQAAKSYRHPRPENTRSGSFYTNIWLEFMGVVSAYAKIRANTPIPDWGGCYLVICKVTDGPEKFRIPSLPIL